MADAPLTYVWSNGALYPLRRFTAEAARRFTAGAVYMMEEVQGRSRISHDHEFAWLNDAWLSLPESLADQYPTAEHLRKRALVAAGYYHETIVDAGTNAAALRVAAYMRNKDEFAVVVVRGPLAVERTPKSQSLRAMGKADFQASKTAIMEVVAELLGTSRDGASQSPSSTSNPSAKAKNQGAGEVASRPLETV